MEAPTMMTPIRIGADTAVLPAYVPIPGMGVLPVNAFVIRAAQPVLVDTGLAALQEDFLSRLASVVALEDLRWIWLTHVDPDHVGAIERVLAAAPRARVVTTFLGMGKMGLHRPLPPERVYLLNPGQELDVGDRRLVAMRPPTFDAPETTGLLDSRTRVLFTSDCFGALLSSPAESAAEIPPAALRDGIVTWTTVDSPWLHGADAGLLAGALREFRDLDPAVVLSSHLPPAEGLTDSLLGHVEASRTATPFQGPDQAALVAMLGAA
jgi:glyoxylase-like metal-dependent hydrolase (beta-lactamase superfamily II)